MIFEQIATGGCQSYLIGCPNTSAGALIDPEMSQVERYQALAAKNGVRIRYIIDTHTHADHFTGAKALGAALGVPIVMHRQSPAPFADMRVDDGDSLKVGDVLLTALHTPGHTRDSMCLVAKDRVFTGDTLLIGGTGRTDLPTGDPEQLYESLFGKLLKLDPALTIYPAHEYKGRAATTIGAEIADNPRLQKKDRAEFVAMMRALDLTMPTHLTEALRVNMSGGASVAQMLASAAASVPFISLAALSDRIAARPERHDHPRCARARRVREGSHPRRHASAARPTRTPRQRSFPPIRPCASSAIASSAKSPPSPPTRCAAWASRAPWRSMAA
ncbi:MAG: MBL fold metallo-hydrolase [Terricaulis sp.]